MQPRFNYPSRRNKKEKKKKKEQPLHIIIRSVVVESTDKRV